MTETEEKYLPTKILQKADVSLHAEGNGLKKRLRN
jgi:hypothetical protein